MQKTERKVIVMSSISGISSSSSLYTQSVREKTNNSKDNSFENTLDSLVSNGTITEDQEDIIAEALKPPTGSKPPAPPKDENPLKAALDELVSDGTITQEQEDAIAQTLAPPEEKPEFSLEEETQNLLQDLLDNLRNNGTITQEQQNAITEAFTPFQITAASEGYLELQNAIQNAAASNGLSTSI